MPMAGLSLDILRSWVPGAWVPRARTARSGLPAAWGLRRPRSIQVTLVLLMLPLSLGSGLLRSLILAEQAQRLISRCNDQLLEALAGGLAA